MFPPMLLYVRVTNEERRRRGVWLPLFLVWLILLPIVVLVAVIAVLADVVLFLAGEPYHRYTLLLFRSFGVLAAARGTTVSIHSSHDVVDIDLV